MSLLAQITPLDLALTLLVMGVVEAVLCRFAPEKMVGPRGWLLRRDVE